MLKVIVHIAFAVMGSANQHHKLDEITLRNSGVVGERPSHASPHNCFSRVMRAHILREGCMERRNYSQPEGCMGPVLHQPAVYVLHAVHLTARRASIEGQLKRLCAADVTWVLCGTKGQYETELTDQQRFCIHPCVADSFWNPTRQPIANGTISLAMKHKGAYIDMMDRNLPSAIILEDDAHLQPTIWEHLSTVRLPADATIYYLGSFTQGDNVFTSKWGDARHEKLHGQHPTGLSVHERNSSLWPAILGGVGYVMFPPGARVLGERVVRELVVERRHDDAALAEAAHVVRPKPQPNLLPRIDIEAEHADRVAADLAVGKEDGPPGRGRCVEEDAADVLRIVRSMALRQRSSGL
jgi:hypothetical protein